jgi:hypothetical protein
MSDKENVIVEPQPIKKKKFMSEETLAKLAEARKKALEKKRALKDITLKKKEIVKLEFENCKKDLDEKLNKLKKPQPVVKSESESSEEEKIIQTTKKQSKKHKKKVVVSDSSDFYSSNYSSEEEPEKIKKQVKKKSTQKLVKELTKQELEERIKADTYRRAFLSIFPGSSL